MRGVSWCSPDITILFHGVSLAGRLSLQCPVQELTLCCVQSKPLHIPLISCFMLLLCFGARWNSSWSDQLHFSVMSKCFCRCLHSLCCSIISKSFLHSFHDVSLMLCCSMSGCVNTRRSALFQARLWYCLFHSSLLIMLICPFLVLITVCVIYFLKHAHNCSRINISTAGVGKDDGSVLGSHTFTHRSFYLHVYGGLGLWWGDTKLLAPLYYRSKLRA